MWQKWVFLEDASLNFNTCKGLSSNCSQFFIAGPAVRVFANGPGDLGSIPGRVIPKTLKWNLIPPCLTLSIIRYGSRVKWRQSWEWSSALPLHLGVVAIEKGAFGSPSTMVANFTYLLWSWWLVKFLTFSDILLSMFVRSCHMPFCSQSISWLHFSLLVLTPLELVYIE